jgi:hypothetical protein
VSDDPRAETLRRAAVAKRAAAVARAEAGLRKLIKTDAQINFRAVAQTAGVSVDFLYRHRELRDRIEHLRSRQQAKPPSPPAKNDQPGDTNTTVVSALTAKLRQARSEVADLKAQLAVAHGELLALRRQRPGAVDDREAGSRP